MEKKQKLLTLWSQTFSTIREHGKSIYVDKTKLIEKLVNMWDSPKVFMSRPRRFWKSLLCSTFKSLFKWEKKYFKWLDIENKWNWKEKFPVIHIMFWTGIVEDKEYLKRQLNEIINENIKKYSDIIVEWENIWDKFKNLIAELSKKFDQKVVIIIDEYDKPILDKIQEIDVAIEIRDELKSFYSAIKNADEYLRFVFITGVSKFSQVSLFSWLNQLKDITFDSDYSTLCWYTKKEIIDNYWVEWYLDWVDLEEMKKWYNWYNFNCKIEEDKVYNPFWILNFFWNNNEYLNYWFKSATPTFLINLLKKNDYPIINFETVNVPEKIMDAFEIENLNVLTLMFQTWYLTIKNKKSKLWWIEYTLGIPNFEVRKSLNEYLVEDYFWFKDLRKKFEKIDLIYYSLLEWSIDWFINGIKSIFSGIPYSSYTKNNIAKYEWFYSNVIYSFLTGAGFDFIMEDITNYWRIDFTIKLWDYIYIVELKVEKSWEESFEQIKSKKYEEKYLSENKTIFLIWINFSQELKNVENYKFEKLKK